MTASRTSPAATLDREFAWFSAVLDARLRSYAEQDVATEAPPPPALAGSDPYAAACTAAGLGRDERSVLALALLPWFRPAALDPLSLRNASTDRHFTEFGGLHSEAGRRFVPTRETSLFIIAADDLDRRIAAMPMFAATGTMVRHHLLVQQADDYAPWLPVEPHPQLIERLLGGTG
ncbi:hypothetical protein ABS767_11810 [Sphingomonas sp. ST-64]|uniref:Uncharacterized protein n=1 Tax=Sphingomonas plantiphila TaxID=3163295 RepID=A0ABW8YR47_9SPHN